MRWLLTIGVRGGRLVRILLTCGVALAAAVALVFAIMASSGGSGGPSAATGPQPSGSASTSTTAVPSPGSSTSAATSSPSAVAPAPSDDPGTDVPDTGTSQAPGATPPASEDPGYAQPRSEESCRYYQQSSVGGNPDPHGTLGAVYVYVACRHLPVTASERTCHNDMEPLANDINAHREALVRDTGEQVSLAVRAFRQELVAHPDGIKALNATGGLTDAYGFALVLCQSTNAFQR